MKFPADRAVGHYHCISRIVDRRFIFEKEEKEQYVKFMREYEAFCQVRVLTFCVMSNHYDILRYFVDQKKNGPRMTRMHANNFP